MKAKLQKLIEGYEKIISAKNEGVFSGLGVNRAAEIERKRILQIVISDLKRIVESEE